MASLPPDATPEQIEEEILFIGIQIESLDPGADDYEDALSKLQSEQQALQIRSKTLQQLNEVPCRPVDGAATALGSSEDMAVNASDNESLADLSIQERPVPGGSKRPRSTSYFLADEPSSKRATPDQAFGDFSNSSGASHVDFTARARRRHEAAEAALQRQRAVQYADAAFARRISEAPPTPPRAGPSAFTSSQPRTQTTLSHDGGYRRLPPIQSMVDAESLPPPNLPQGDRTRTLPWQEKPWDLTLRQPSRSLAGSESGFVKQEPARSSRYTHTGLSLLGDRKVDGTSGRTAAVVDLTGSDSDDMDVKEVGSRHITSEYGAPGPSRPLGYSSNPLWTMDMPHVPGAYPGSTPANSTSYQNPTFPSQHHPYGLDPTLTTGGSSRSMQTGPKIQMADFRYLMTGSPSANSAAFEYIDSGDEYSDDVYGDPHHMRYSAHGMNGYAGRRDLYNDRYNMLANYDSTKSKEEIEALLKNIRPDEDMPAHLRVKTPDSMTCKLHKYQELGLTWLQKCEDGSNNGGILADDMGLGKTIQMLSLMVTRKSQDPRCKTTLIVAPVALMRQWKQEIQQKVKSGVNHRLTVFTHHGTSKKKDFRDLQLYDIVLTTYGSLAVEVKKMETFHARRRIDPDTQPYPKEKCVLIGEDARWYRVILDEAQCIKNKSTQTSKGACMVNAKFRWCMSGTPMMNSVEELFSLIRFLRIKPYNQWEKFRLDFKAPLQGRDGTLRQTAMRRLQTLCKAIMLRRTKKSTFEGVPILVLPERTTEVDSLQFSADERDLYQALETQSQLIFNKYLRAGTVGKSYTAILVLLLRLRQACCHPHLINDFGVSAAADLTEEQMLEMAHELSEPVVARIKAMGGTFECPVCYDVTPNPAIFIPCGHDACSECFAKLTDPAEAIQQGEEGSTRFKCPNCRGPIDPKRVTDFANFKKVHAPDMFTKEETAAMRAAENDEAEESDEEESEAEGDGDGDDDEEGDDSDDDGHEEAEEDQSVKKDQEDVTTTKAEGDSDDDDLDKAAQARRDPTATIKQENTETGTIDPPKSASKGKSNAKAKSKKSKKGKGKVKGKGKGKEKEKKKKVKAALTLAELKKRANRNIASRKQYVRRIRKDWITSAKIDKTMDILQEIMVGEEREKVLIFSQWTSLLDLLEVPIDDAGYGYRRYDGSMNARMRGDAVDDFRDDSKDVRIMLVSLKAGNAGLNLNMASQVIILDPFWNPYIEEQAIDRAHRIGQRLPVKVHRVLIENTVEDRILGIQEKKRALISEALDEKAGQSLSRLGVQELAYLFGVTANPAQQIDYVPRERRA